MALTGTRILNPSRSLTAWIGLVELVICRKPLAQMRSMTTKFASLICLRNAAPRSPSSAS